MFFSTKALNLLAWYETITLPKPRFATLLSLEGRRRRDRRIPRVSLQDYSASAFKTVLDSNNDQALLNACGHDHASFQCLLELFEPIYCSHFLNRDSGFIEPVTLLRLKLSTSRPGKSTECASRTAFQSSPPTGKISWMRASMLNSSARE
jgi:hypothetical protein